MIAKSDQKPKSKFEMNERYIPKYVIDWRKRGLPKNIKNKSISCNTFLINTIYTCFNDFMAITWNITHFFNLLLPCAWFNGVIFKVPNICKAGKNLKGRLDLILSPSLSVKIQIMGGKVCLRCKGKKFWKKSCYNHPAMFFHYTSSKLFPHNLNFHWKWRW